MNTELLLARRRRELHALGHSLFSKRWDVARHTLIAQLTDYASASSKDLTLAQLETLTADLRQRRMAAALQRDEVNSLTDQGENDDHN